MIFEMTRELRCHCAADDCKHDQLLHLSRFQKQPIYEALAHQDGIHLPSHSTRNEPNQRTVLQIMRKTPEILPAEMACRGCDRTNSRQ